MGKFLKYILPKLIIVGIVLALDLVAKSVLYGNNTNFIPSLIAFRDCELNTGGAWSFLSGNVTLLVILTSVFLVVAIIFDIFFKNQHKLYIVSFSFILGGAIGNLIDRIVFGGVRDFIFFEFMPTFPTFNLADCFLCVGFILLAIFVIFIYKGSNQDDGQKKDKKS
ncbi:MAG: signal peptidase II [Clostridia bacterium]|nr:signal peptidase II [Clostridia bacterium]